mmetsp:Transcript_7723/g.18640  ORF Transcript_7723/g.18640 Transcript_7723/m.18640 type:complete len:206 (+) Transcript_7723:3052-3669(+)
MLSWARAARAAGVGWSISTHVPVDSRSPGPTTHPQNAFNALLKTSTTATAFTSPAKRHTFGNVEVQGPPVPLAEVWSMEVTTWLMLSVSPSATVTTSRRESAGTVVKDACVQGEGGAPDAAPRLSLPAPYRLRVVRAAPTASSPESWAFESEAPVVDSAMVGDHRRNFAIRRCAVEADDGPEAVLAEGSIGIKIGAGARSRRTTR